MNNNQPKLLSRRAFARRAAFYSASAALIAESTVLPSGAQADPSAQLPTDLPKLTPESQAEAESRFQLVLSRHGTRLTEEDKRSIRILCYYSQPGLDRLRSFTLKNSDVPALFLKPIVEREKPLQSNRPATAPVVAPKHS